MNNDPKSNDIDCHVRNRGTSIGWTYGHLEVERWLQTTTNVHVDIHNNKDWHNGAPDLITLDITEEELGSTNGIFKAECYGRDVVLLISKEVPQIELASSLDYRQATFDYFYKGCHSFFLILTRLLNCCGSFLH